ncbi:dephospho-CoA kinase [Dysgonomonas macrotermitis]|uniref:Dephospho-CoA kinase n=1 Tax=Dysgonomonas macrotermitis TaxID=1346286 RepID=A0A1M5ACA6_9BACT|nr:dephospho-CoA kinase [Dysgonomonas macrotermitis]SHF27961.1 dephospho-CoA kinase [Dysgonomonas macrotermitis]
MIKLGITGGIGSGKSTVSEILKIMGIPVYIADIESKKLTESSPIIREKLIDVFGSDLYEGDKLNKPLLASYIFNDKNKLAIANSIIHPEVDKHFINWVEKKPESPIVAVETAILFESGMNRFTDKTLMVYTPLEERIKRTMLRDNTTMEKVKERINSQVSDEEKIKLTDYIIYNDEKQSLIEQCKNLIHNIQQ